jgi:hypothetical protein
MPISAIDISCPCQHLAQLPSPPIHPTRQPPRISCHRCAARDRVRVRSSPQQAYVSIILSSVRLVDAQTRTAEPPASKAGPIGVSSSTDLNSAPQHPVKRQPARHPSRPSPKAGVLVGKPQTRTYESGASRQRHTRRRGRGSSSVEDRPSRRPRSASWPLPPALGRQSRRRTHAPCSAHIARGAGGIAHFRRPSPVLPR